MRDPGLIVYPDRHARCGQGLDATCSPARRSLIGDQPNIDVPLLRADERPNNAGADCQTIGANKDLPLGIVDRADGEGRTVLLRREANRYRRVR